MPYSNSWQEADTRPLINIVWFKKDLRLHDHAPLKAALECQLPLLLIYIFEPSLRQAADWDIRHWQFVHQAILSLNETLQQKYHTQIYPLHSEVLPTFEYLLEHYQIHTVFSHQETGNALSYERDKKMAKFFKERNIIWKEFQSNGVIRGLKNRKNWNKLWKEYMLSPTAEPNWQGYIPVNFEPDARFLPDYSLQKKLATYPTTYQPAGEKYAWAYLKNFFGERIKGYTKYLSKPETSRLHSSRISVYLTWGNLSSRQVYQYYQAEKEKGNPKVLRELKNFRSRLQWRCHFIQKFEMENRMEFEPINRGYLNLEQPINPTYLQAWQEGKTGYPLVDACMRCVRATGFLNFRMRAMLVSFLTHILWQPWQSGVHFLARQFLDYEIGIHFPQFQMQAGVTGINTVRVYNPIKQSKEQDKDAVFIKKWLPELHHIPPTLIHEPWKMTLFEQQFYQCIIGKDYPAPIVDAEAAAKKASEILWQMQKQETVLAENQRILSKHVREKRATS